MASPERNWRLADYERARRLCGAQENPERKITPSKSWPSEEIGTARTAAARAFDRIEVELHAAPACRREVSGLQLGRGEPGTFKDRDIMRYNPHILIEGMAIGAYAMAFPLATTTFMAKAGGRLRRMEEALDEARERRICRERTSCARF
jgi:NADH-quinone oxidoreductase subunit F